MSSYLRVFSSVLFIKATFTQSCDLLATFERPENWPGRSVVGRTQKVLFLCNYCSTTLVRSSNHQNCCSGTTVEWWVEAEPLPWWLNGCRGRRMEAQWSPEWSLKGRYWSAKGDTVVVQGRQKHSSNWYKMFTTVRNFFTGRPMTDLCIHSANTAMRMYSSCLLWATCGRPTSWATFVRLLWTCSKLHGDHGVHGKVWTSSVPPLNHQGKLSASVVPSTATWPVWWSHKGGTKVAVSV